MKKYTTTQEYLNDSTGETRQRLDAIRAMVMQLAPNATERISYNMPAFFNDKKIIIYMAGYAHHTSIYPGRVATPEYEALAAEYMSGRSTLKFPNDKPLPITLIEQFIQLRLKEIS